ncbi:chitin synthase-domain-containing protein [Paraphoma chrysanthemicola]|uniref:chitin synthase n=1 Tax=Paraphoma chrysanthemicola TaxID=798071 RepID=A0A8K0RI06_9PLEO|nr:chitin synthase-domain-containing protein [Paraphoma chrysanthemicola]
MALHLLPGHPGLSSRSTLHVDSDDGTESSYGVENRFRDKLFACPYVKHDPLEYSEVPSCYKSGWKSISGVRQHVYRCHILPIKCPGCAQEFESSRLFARHLHTEAHCDRSLDEIDEPVKGLETLLQKIKTPKVTPGDPSEEDMWKVIYTSLFPDDPKNEIPSPYFDKEQGTPIPISSYGSAVSSIYGGFSAPITPSVQTPHNGKVQQDYFGSAHHATSSIGSSHAARNYTRPTTCSGLSQYSNADDISEPNPFADGNGASMPSSIRNSASTYNMPQAPEAVVTRQEVQSSTGKKLKKKLRHKTMESQVIKFQAWEKPHRTDEHITPGVYRGFWIWIARFFTFWIPSWFLTKFLGMNDFRQRLAFRQKVLFCVVLAAIYGLIIYFLVIQPIASCVVKVNFGMISNDSNFCGLVSGIIYVYMGLGGAFMLLVAVCVIKVRYTNRSFEEHKELLVMQIPCYNEDEETLRKTIESCVQSSYEKKRKLLFIVADGLVAAAGEKPTYRILLEDIFKHSDDLEIGIDNKAHTYLSFDTDGAADNQAFTALGHYRGVPYVIVIKTGREDERDAPKPGNRGKRDSQLLAYNFFHYVNYRKGWNPLFENLEFKMRTSLNLDAREAMYMLAIDCDTAVDRTGISYLVDKLQKKPKLLGVCGYTGVSNHMSSFVSSSQVFEYWLTHAVLKAVESVCSSVFVLSGCFTIYRLKWPNNRPAILHPLLLEDYAGTYDKTLHEHNLLSIGEDRYLSTLAIRYFGADCRLQYFSAATCTTVVPDKLSVLLDQRRRWTNSLIHCHFAHLNVPPFEASIWTHVRLLFVLFCELFMVFILPLALPAGAALAVISVLLTPYGWAVLLAFSLIPVVLCILCMDWTYIPFYLPFFPMIGMFSVIIPIYSLWNQDNIKWGKTRGG